jgi:hypothetical protein
MADDLERRVEQLRKLASERRRARGEASCAPANEGESGWHYDFDAANERDLDEADIAARNWIRAEERHHNELRQEELREAEEWREICRRQREWLAGWRAFNPRRPH